MKSFDYTLLRPWLKTGLLTRYVLFTCLSKLIFLLSNSNNEKWRSRRRLITPSFHDTQLLHDFMIIFNEQSRILARRFDEYTQQADQIHNLYPSISACTLDIIAG